MTLTMTIKTLYQFMSVRKTMKTEWQLMTIAITVTATATATVTIAIAIL